MILLSEKKQLSVGGGIKSWLESLLGGGGFFLVRCGETNLVLRVFRLRTGMLLSKKTY